MRLPTVCRSLFRVARHLEWHPAFPVVALPACGLRALMSAQAGVLCSLSVLERLNEQERAGAHGEDNALKSSLQ